MDENFLTSVDTKVVEDGLQELLAEAATAQGININLAKDFSKASNPQAFFDNLIKKPGGQKDLYQYLKYEDIKAEMLRFAEERAHGNAVDLLHKNEQVNFDPDRTGGFADSILRAVTLIKRGGVAPKDISKKDSFPKELKETNVNDAVEFFNGIALRLIFTAHPTQPRHQARIAVAEDFRLMLEEMAGYSKSVDKNLTKKISDKMSALLSVPSIPDRRMSVQEEVERSLHYMNHIFDSAIATKEKIVQAFVDIYGNKFGAPQEQKLNEVLGGLFRIGSWAGFESDGNPNVTPAETRLAVQKHRQAILKNYQKFITEQLLKTLGPDDQKNKSVLKLKEYISSLQEMNDGGKALPHNALTELKQLVKNLSGGNKKFRKKSEELSFLVDNFGLNFGRGDLRQHADITKATVHALVEFETGKKINWAKLSQDEKLKLYRDLSSVVPSVWQKFTLGAYKDLAPDLLQEMERIKVARENPDVIKNWIISNCETIDDYAAVMALRRLSKEALPKHKEWDELRIIPLCESKAALENMPNLMQQMLKNFRSELHGNLVFMVGYSDTQKSHGPGIIGLTDHAIRETIGVLQDYNQKNSSSFKLDLFHGGSLDEARGGGIVMAMREHATWQGQDSDIGLSTSSSVMRHLEKVIFRKVRNRFEKPNVDSLEERADSWEKFRQPAIGAYENLFKENGFSKALKRFFAQVAPYHSLVKRFNFSSRANSRGLKEADQNIFADLFKDGLKKQPDIVETKDLRAISQGNLIQMTFTNSDNWYSLLNGFEAMGGEDVLLKQIETSDSFKGLLRKAMITLAAADFDISWHYLPENQRPKNDAERRKWAEEFSKYSGEKGQEMPLKYMLAYFHERGLETQQRLNGLLETVEKTHKGNFGIDADYQDLIGNKKIRAKFGREFLAWIHRKVMDEKPLDLVFSDLNKAQIQDMVGAAFITNQTYRIPSRHRTDPLVFTAAKEIALQRGERHQSMGLSKKRKPNLAPVADIPPAKRQQSVPIEKRKDQARH